MKARLLVLLPLLLAATFLWVSQAGGQSGFIISNADATTDIATSGSSGLSALLATVGPRFVVERANGMEYLNLTGSSLPPGFGPIEARFIFEHANANSFTDYLYPVGLIQDKASPQISSPQANLTVSGEISLEITTNEYTVLVLEYGLQPGVYTVTLTFDEYQRSRQITLSGLPAGATCYYRMSATDRSGNTATSPEYSFRVQDVRMIFLPALQHR